MRTSTTCLLLLLYALAFVSVQAREFGREYKDETLLVSTSKEGDRLSVVAKGALRREMFTVLRVAFGLEVRPIDQPDEPVWAKFSNLPLEQGLAQLLPKGSRFVFRVDRDVTIQGYSSEKTGPGAEAEGRSKKPKDGPLGPVAPGAQKPESRSVRVITDVQVKGGKPRTKASLDVPASKGGKVAQTGAPAQTGAVRLTFLLRSSGELLLTQATEVEGQVPPSRFVQGPFFFIVRDSAGALRYAESQLHPLGQHSYRPDGTHDQTRAAQGLFGVWLPKELLRKSPTGLRLQFIDAEGLSLPAELDERTLQRILKEAKPVAELRVEEVLYRLEKGPDQHRGEAK